MRKRVAINGFGRIGRMTFRQMMEAGDLEVVAVNDIAPLDNLVYLLRHDSAYNPPDATVAADDNLLRWNDREIRYMSVRNPGELPWKDIQVDIAIEATGLFTKYDDAAKHLDAGAGHVIITAPAKGQGADLTICMGVNEDQFNPEQHKVLSSASCTTNCLAPVAKVLDDGFGIVTGFLTTVHAYTSTQGLVDTPSKKWRRGRAAAVSIVPTTTGAATATTEVIPHLKGKLDGMAMRVPTLTGSIIDFVAQTERPVSVEHVNDAFARMSQDKRMRGILGVTNEELVSMDIVGSTYSALVDLQSTMTLGDHTVKVLAWYDNEWGYARRVVDLAEYVGRNA
ncbi:MAG: type I glyceraldehyde-3-phosphate dehydrogenase [Chloroflexaceae bacterium]